MLFEFKTGQKVRCIDDKPHSSNPKVKELIKGNVYTILAHNIAIKLEEVDYTWSPTRFEPVFKIPEDWL